jgi:transposase
MPASIFGRPTKCTFNSMVRAAACGSRQKSRIPSYCTPPTARVGGISRPCARGMGVLCSVGRTGTFNGVASFILQQLRSASRGTGRRVVVIPDNARYRHSRLHGRWREKNAHLALYFLLPYSPELNPIERAWKLTRRHCIHDRCFENLKGVINAVESEFATWTKCNEVLRRLCAST